MDRCYLCGDDAYFHSSYLKQKLCKKHFEKMMVRRIRGGVSSLGFSRKTYRLIPDGSIGYRLNSFFFRHPEGKDIDVGNLLLDDFAMAVFKYFVTKEKTSMKVKSRDYFNPLYLISREEAAAFLKLKRIDYTETEDKDADLASILDRLEAKRPGAKISIVRSGIAAGLI